MADPIGLEGGLNPYSYVENNPINGADPTGEIGIFGIAALGLTVLTTADFVVTTYQDYQIFKILDAQEALYWNLMAEADPCSERYNVLKEAHDRVVLDKAAIAAKMGMNLLTNVYGYLKPTPHPHPNLPSHRRLNPTKGVLSKNVSRLGG